MTSDTVCHAKDKKIHILPLKRVNAWADVKTIGARLSIVVNDKKDK